MVAAIDRLASLELENFASVIDGLLGPDADAGAWAALTSPALVQRTAAVLSAKHRDIQDQLAQRSAAIAAVKDECHTRGETGRQDYFTAKRAYTEWHRRAKNYERLVSSRVQFVKLRLRETTRQVDSSRYRDSLRELAAGVAAHRDRVTSGNGSEDDDDKLWKLLSSLEVDTREGPMTLEAWLAYADAAARNKGR